ncbi:YbbN family protein [Methanomassiliicoccus luminyensis]|jgi:thiol-disulfide isomerase/thioredoxin|uniref:thioredoxin family protein n=1 Tax=Methanomassiliicoccus luminyensis TaxID=1080712 RepID=UPI00037F3386|nr:thioredoxin family protein [Methanomassiliicoccus luminyensis]
MAEQGQRLIFFWGRECPHCAKIHPLVGEVSKEMGKEITELEVWHSEENQKLMRSYGDVLKQACGGSLGVPAFYNERTKKALCGMRTTKEQIVTWASE